MNLHLATPPPRGRRRDAKPMSTRTIIAGCAAVVLIGLFAGYYTDSGHRGPLPEVRSSSGFDVSYVSGGTVGGGSAAAKPSSFLSGSAATPSSSSSPAPVSAPGMFKRPDPSPGAVTLQTASEGRVTKDPKPGAPSKDSRFSAMMESPLKFLMAKTHLGSARALQFFVRDPKRVAGYLAHPLVKETLDSSVAVSLLLRAPIARAFVATPAMNDRAAVSALAKSGLVKEIAHSPGVREALKDQRVVSTVLADPEILGWAGRNPDVIPALQQFGLSLGAGNATGRSR